MSEKGSLVESGNWWLYAVVSAVAASLTAITAKLGVRDVPSNVATAIRTAVVLVFAWGIVIATGEVRVVSRISGRSYVFLILSGLATGVSWLAYFRALALGPASRVAPVDKLSLPITVLLASLLLREPITLRLGVGVALILAGTLLAIR